MVLSLTPVDAAGRDRDELVAFLTTEDFPFHVRRHPTAVQVTADIDAGAWDGADAETFWLDDDDQGRVGLVRLNDLGDPTAMIDLRLAGRRRGRGFGARAVPLAADHAFRTRPGVVRVEGHTREDNAAMRRTFEKCGWVREGWFRDGWPVEGGDPMASLAYSVTRRDWASGTTTPVPRESEKTPTDRPTRADGRVQDAATLAADAWAAEERLLDPAVRADAEELRALLADDFTEIGQSGRFWHRDDIVTALVAEPPASRPPVIDERECRLIGPDTVLLTYRLRFDGRSSRRSSVWRCDPRPRCVFHQGTRVPE